VKRHSATVSLPTAIIIFVANNYVGSKEKLFLYNMLWSNENNTFVSGAVVLQEEHTILGFLTLQTEPLGSFETSVTFYHWTRLNIPINFNFPSTPL